MEELTTPKVWSDESSGLMWQLQTDGNEYDYEECFGYADTLNVQNYCGFSDWRFPTLADMETLIDRDGYDNPLSITKKSYIKEPLVDSLDMKYATFWCNKRFDYDNAWCISFYDGSKVGTHISSRLNIRCVRSING